MSKANVTFPDTISVPNSTVVYEKVKEGEPGYNPRKTHYRARAPPTGKSFKDAEQAKRLWQAHPDPENSNVLYFNNPGSKDTTWNLPDLEVVDDTKPTTTNASSPSAAAAADTTSNASSSATSADAIKKAIQEKLAAKMAGMRSGNTSSSASTAGAVAPTATATPSSSAQKPPLAVNTSNTETAAQSTLTTTRTPRASSGGAGSWRDRLAERRGKSPGAPSTPNQSSLNPSENNNNNAATTPVNQNQNQTTHSPSPSEQSRYSERRNQLQQQQQQQPTQNESNSTEQQQQATPTASSPVVKFNEEAVVHTYEQEAESAKVRAAKLELQLQQRRLLQAQQEEAHQRELEEMQQKRREAEARRLELELERVKLLSEKKNRQEQMLANFHRGDPDEVRAHAQQKLEEAREEARKQFFSQVRDRDTRNNNSVTPVKNNANGHSALHDSSPSTQHEPVPPVDTSSLEEEVQKRLIDYGKNFTYSGQVMKDRPAVRHGKGVFQYGGKDEETGRNTTYDGEWRNHFKNGWGTMNLPTSMYEGDWLNDKAHGRGTLRTRQMQATAPFQKGVAHGNDAVVQIRGQGTFQGPVRNNKGGKSGQMRIPHSTSESGHQTKKNNNNLIQDRPGNSSSARKNSASSQNQQQQHLSDHPLGAMEIEWKWVDESSPGSGEVCATFADGNVYVGSMKNYALSGPGRLIFASTGDEYLGDFSSNVMQGKGLYRFAVDGSVYEGEMRDGSFNGVGSFATPTFLYEGEWRDGQMHGKGRIKYENGDVWEGTFENHRRSEGRYTFSSVFALEEAVHN